MTDGRKRAAAAAGRPIPDGGKVRPERAYELTDPQGRRPLTWWTPDGWTVEAEDQTFRRRVTRAPRTLLWARQDAIGPDGIRASYLVQFEPADPRHPIELRWR